MKPVEEGQHILRPVRQLRPMSWIAAGLELDIFAIHIALDGGQMPDNVGKAEFAFGIAPDKLLRRNAGNHLLRAPADLFVVVEKFVGINDFHKGIAYRTLDISVELFALKFFQA